MEDNRKLEDLRQVFSKTGLDTITRVFPQKIMSSLFVLFFGSLPPDLLASALQKAIDDAFGSASVSLRPSGMDLNLDCMLSHKRRKLSEDNYLDDHFTISKPIWDMLPDLTRPLSQCLKSECETLVQHTDRVLLWLASTQRNATNLEAREVLLSELHRAQEAGINMHEMTGRYYLSRAELCSKIDKNPGIEDYVLALQEHDQHHLFLVRQNLHDVRNIYMSLYGIMKNILA